MCPARAMAQMKAASVSGDRHHHLVSMGPPCREVSERLASSPLGLPPDGLAGLWELLQSPWERAAARRRRPVGPGALDEGPAGEGLAGFGEAALAAACATGVRTGGEAQRAHERSGVRNTAQVAELGDAGDGDRELDATHCLERRNDRGETPSLDRRPAFGLEALQPCLMGRHGADVLLHDQLLRRRGTDHFRQPAQMSGPPGGPALIPEDPVAAGRPSLGTWRPGDPVWYPPGRG